MIYYETRLDMIAATGGHGAEIGVQRGVFSEQILPHVASLALIDAWDSSLCDPRDPARIPQGGQEENYRKVCERFDFEPKVRILRMSSLEAASHFKDRSLDWVYLDAGHDYVSVMEDLTAWARVVRDCIMGHDYTRSDEAVSMGFGVVAAVNDFCDAFGWEVVALTGDEWLSFKLERRK